MTTETTTMANAIGILRDAYPRQQFPDRTVALYGAALADLDGNEVAEAVGRLIRTSAFLPSIAEIRREVAEARAALPTPEEAWTIVHQPRAKIPPEIRGALDDVGGRYAIRTGTPERTRRMFLDAYTARRESTLLAVMIDRPPHPLLTTTEDGPTMRALPESTRIRPRPVIARLARRYAGRDVGPTTNEERADAIEILRDGPEPGIDPLYAEAERILADATAEDETVVA